MDMNFFPQAAGLNRGTTRQGSVWKAMERHAIEHPGTALSVRPIYEDGIPLGLRATLPGGISRDAAILSRFIHRKCSGISRASGSISAVLPPSAIG